MNQPGVAAEDAAVELRVEAPAGAGPVPVTAGAPWPRGALPDAARLSLCDAAGRAVPVQARALDLWPDGSVRWALLDWQAEPGGAYTAAAGGVPTLPEPPVRVHQDGPGTVVDTGAARFELTRGEDFPFRAVTAGGEPAVDAARTGFAAEDEHGCIYPPYIYSVTVEEPGPLRALLRLRGVLIAHGAGPLADLQALLHFYAGSAVVRFDLTLTNPRAAAHPGGLWDLGNGGSIYLRDASLTFALPPGAGAAELRLSPEVGAPFAALPAPVELYQDSSGGENWKSRNHLNRRREVPNTFRGYRLRAGGAERAGLRATPALSLTRGGRSVGVAVPWFWQNFPKAVEASADAVTLRLFPRQYADVHELQGGEQKTHTFYALFGGPPEALAWCRQPPRAAASPAWYCATGAVPYLTPKADDPNAGYLRLVDAALEGEDTFDAKREVIDEYGWRHFGDIYGDHEAAFHKGPAPLLSHYNNQYDPVAGFAYQYLRSGDGRWHRHMTELAAHVIDIDVYHTARDKSAYNGGMFWHTYHYFDADTGTHRAYPRALAKVHEPGEVQDYPEASAAGLRGAYAVGGGPGASHNYTTGLMLCHLLTGDPLCREAVVGLARWVVALDDGRQNVFRWLDAGPTGHATASAGPLYHGPGRASANSLLALLDAHRLTGDPAFRAKAEQLLRRCIHPRDDVAARDLGNVELRWFYTMFLQALGRYLDDKAERGEVDGMYAYGRESLLHYARWMAEHEYPYLDKPERLQYPNETWPAQDMRKSEVFKYAAKHAAGAERARFLERSEFFFRASTEALAGMKTRTRARPVVLMLSYGFMHAFFQRHPDTSAPAPAAPADFGSPEVFVPQKVRAKKRFVMLAAAAVGLSLAALVVALVYQLR